MPFGTVLLICIVCVVILAALLVVFVIALYNAIQHQLVLVNEAWSGIDVQLKKRFDLIPNLVETVKGYASHESGLFEKVAQLRTGMMNTSSPEELGKMEGELRGTLKTLFAVAEAYPELKANQNFLGLQSSLQEIENELEGARRYYNGAVRDLNTKLVVFPNNVIANLLNLKTREFFEVEGEAERQNVKVDFTPTATTTAAPAAPTVNTTATPAMPVEDATKPMPATEPAPVAPAVSEPTVVPSEPAAAPEPASPETPATPETK